MKDFIKIYQNLNEVVFHDSNHCYIVKDTGELLDSVTTVLKQYQEPFHANYWATYKALEESEYKVKSHSSKKVPYEHILIDDTLFFYRDLEGWSTNKWATTPFSLKERWRYESRFGRTRGSIVHSYVENKWLNKVNRVDTNIDFLKEEDVEYFKTTTEKLCSFADNFITDHPHLIPVRLELITYDLVCRIAGQCDGLFWDTEKEVFVLIDYKTDKKIDDSNRWQHFRYPLNHLSDCELNKYSLQLGLYKRMFEQATGITIVDCYIIWLNPDNDNYELINTLKLDDDVELILNDRRV